MKNKQLGYDKDDIANSPYASFYNPDMAPLQEQVAEAVMVGEVAFELMYPIEKAAQIQDEGYWPVENGFTRTPQGGADIFCLTKMPGVTPQMWDWWFGWHGSDHMRYRLWHPKAHKSATWKDGQNELIHYIGRTSYIEEYLGSVCKKGAITFVAPSTMGLDEKKLAERGEVAICARISLPKTPLKAGWLLHHIRPVPGGSEMRSRTWLGGANVALGDNPGLIGKAVGVALAQLCRAIIPDPAAVMVHTSQEMSHLASFLPELYQRFNGSGK